MRRFSFERRVGTELSDHGSSAVTWVPVVRQANPDYAGVDVMHVGPGGLLGRHPAGRPQLFLVAAGSGWVATGDGQRELVAAGDAVLWEPGEVHESGSDEGMVAAIIQLGGLADADLRL